MFLAHRGPCAPGGGVRSFALGPILARSRRLPAWALAALAVSCSLSEEGGEIDGGGAFAPTPGTAPPGLSALAAAPVELEDVAAARGVDFVHETGASGRYLMPEIMAGGAAIFDFDGDGALDLYFVQSGATVPAPGEAVSNQPDRLYRQRGDGAFEDDTTRAGLESGGGYGMGAAVGDIDNDGDLDLFVSNYGPDVLYRNEGDGTFRDVTASFGVGDPGWSASAVFCDFDRDGFLDLYVTRYLRFDPGRECAQQGGRRDYCGPTEFAGVSDLLYRNRDGRGFENVSVGAGIAEVEDASLGVVCEDLDDDGWPDFYVANDADPNNLWINRHDGTFTDEALLLGAAFNRLGSAEAGMGVAAGDLDLDGDLDLLVTNLIEETNTYYLNQGMIGFEDVTAVAGLGVGSMDSTGFGVALFDLENDGDLDATVVNGAVKRRSSPCDPSIGGLWGDYAERDLLFVNDGAGSFAAAPPAAGPGATPAVSRAVIPADLDGDGKLELVVTTLGGAPRIYRVRGGAESGSWVAIDAVDPELRRIAVGARVTVSAGGRRWVRTASAAGGYLSGTAPRIHLGLGGLEEVEGFEVRWPDGGVEHFPGGPARRVVTLRRGEGEPARKGQRT